MITLRQGEPLKYNGTTANLALCAAWGPEALARLPRPSRVWLVVGVG